MLSSIENFKERVLPEIKDNMNFTFGTELINNMLQIFIENKVYDAPAFLLCKIEGKEDEAIKFYGFAE
jgi:hypothetical protein